MKTCKIYACWWFQSWRIRIMPITIPLWIQCQEHCQENTYLKNALNPSCFDFFIPSSILSFQNTIAVSNGLSDFHKMVVTVTKISFKKHFPIKRYYRDYKYFDRTRFKNNLNEKLSEGISNYETHLKLLTLNCWTNMPH